MPNHHTRGDQILVEAHGGGAQAQAHGAVVASPTKHRSPTFCIIAFILRRERNHPTQHLFPSPSEFRPLQLFLRQPKHLSCFRRCKRRKRRHHQIAVLCKALSLTSFKSVADLGAKVRVVEDFGPGLMRYGWSRRLCWGKRALRCTGSSLSRS